jgi:hypothetical protein
VAIHVRQHQRVVLLAELELKRELRPYAGASQYQQSPTPRSGAVVDPNGFKPLPEDRKREDLPTVQFWDLGYSEKAMADHHTVAVTVTICWSSMSSASGSPRRTWRR